MRDFYKAWYNLKTPLQRWTEGYGTLDCFLKAVEEGNVPKEAEYWVQGQIINASYST